jgi:hypothetical protein
MRTSRRYWVGALVLSGAWLLAGGCSATSKEASGNRGDGGGNVGGSQGAPSVIETDAGLPDTSAFSKLDQLCGASDMDGSCVPDDPRACSTFVPPVEPELGSGGAGGESGHVRGAAGEASLGGAGGAHEGGAGAGGEGGRSSAGAPSAAGAPTSPGAAGSSDGRGGEGGEGNVSPAESSYACQVTRQNNRPARQCTRAGSGLANAPCFSAADCAAGLACVGDGDAGRCRPYCCDPDTQCQSGAYCAERTLRRAPSDTSNVEPPHVPVCVPADNCSLEERFPCPADADCRCKGDTACMVVRDDGSTACLKPGPGTQGEPCPCAWNHVCSRLTKECVKLCRTDSTDNECGSQKCQASSELPTNFGVCVGPT